MVWYLGVERIAACMVNMGHAVVLVWTEDNGGEEKRAGGGEQT